MTRFSRTPKLVGLKRLCQTLALAGLLSSASCTARKELTLSGPTKLDETSSKLKKLSEHIHGAPAKGRLPSQTLTATNWSLPPGPRVESCPDKASEWARLIPKALKTLPSPAHMELLAADINDCLSKEKAPEPWAQRCATRLDTLGKAQNNNFFVAKPRRKITTEPHNLPPILLHRNFSESVMDENLADEQIAKQMSRLQKSLPKGSKTAQFIASATGRRTFTTVVPDPAGETYYHYHSNDEVAYLIMRVFRRKDGKPLRLPRLEFSHASEARAYDKRGPIQFEQDDEREKARTQQHCNSCHRGSAPVLIADKGSFISHTDGFTAPELKSWFADNRVALGDPSDFSFDHLGPPIGPKENPKRTKDSMNQCFSASATADTPLDNKQKAIVINSMNCTGCHQSSGLGKAHLRGPWPGSFAERVFDNHITSGYMPRGKHPLTKPMRKSLVHCLKAEYYGGFTDEAVNRGNPETGLFLDHLLNGACNPPEQ